jgi:hypothetical protein
MGVGSAGRTQMTPTPYAPSPLRARAASRLAPTALALLGLLFVVAARAGAAPAQGQPESSLLVSVTDARGAVVIGASVRLKTAAGVERAVETDSRGRAQFSGLAAGECRVEVEAAGFETQQSGVITLAPGKNSQAVALEVARVREEVVVGQDAREASLDPRGRAFTTVLTEEQIAQLPDDPEDLAEALREIAGPGAVIRVNGFSGGRLPPKSQIREIRFRLNPYAPENHDAGMVSVDIYTKPGGDTWHGALNLGFRDDALDARNPFAPRRAPEQYRRVGLSLDGPLLRQRTSLFLSAQGTLAFDSKPILAALPEGRLNSLASVPSRYLNLDARVEHALDRTHTLRGEYQRNAVAQNNLGVGDFDLPERAFSFGQAEHLLRLSDTGAVGKRFVNEARFQLRWQRNESLPLSDAPAVLVPNAFDGGGAQLRSRRRLRELELADNLDFATAKHSMKAGLIFEGGRYEDEDRTNFNGTFTFAGLDTFRARRPITFTRREGEPAVSYSQYEFGWYWQDDFRVRKDLLLSYGVRHEVQTNMGDRNNFAPRLGFAWSPFADGKTTVRGGAGVFYDWFAADAFENTLRVDGLRQRDIVILNPGFPDPFAGGTLLPLPPSRIRAEPGLRMPYVEQFSLGVERQLSRKLLVRANYMRQRGVHLLRGRNVNAPVAGLGRPDPSAGNVTQIESSANSTLRQLNVNLSPGQTLLTKRLYWLVNYTLSSSVDEADGPLSLPADNFDLRPERGPSLFDSRHRLFILSNVRLFRQWRLGVTLRGASATPYNVITGFDDNGDTVANDRPAGVGRNRARGAAHWEASARLSWGFGFGERPAAQQGGGASVVRARTDSDTLGALSSARGINSRWRVQLYVQAYNVFNHSNLINFTGVQTSPFFGRATGALPGRRLETGLSFSF